VSREDVELIRRAFEAFTTEGYARGTARYLAEDEVYVEDPIWPEASTYNGRDAIVARFYSYMEMLGAESNWTVTVEDVVEAADHYVAIVRTATRGSASGMSAEHVWAYAVRVRDGKLSHMRAYYEPAEALGDAQNPLR
jgi:ketosteroid isomerase-like protein